MLGFNSLLQKTARAQVLKSATSCVVRRQISSVSFSGAGFVATYHYGAAQALIDHGYLLGEYDDAASKDTPVMVGVSSGALVAAALAAGVQPQHGLETILDLAKRSQAAGSRFAPGHSMVDIIEEVIGDTIMTKIKRDSEKLLRRIENGRLLRIWLTDRRIFPPIFNSNAVVYIDRYRDLEDVLAAAILSCYMPGITGPVKGSYDERNGAIRRASERLQELLELGYVKDGRTGKPLIDQESTGNIMTSSVAKRSTPKPVTREIFWDGAMNNLCPVVDEKTVVITPVIAQCRNPSIAPVGGSKFARMMPTIPCGSGTRVYLTMDNMWLIRGIDLDDGLLRSKFELGYNDAREFLSNYNAEVAQSAPINGR